MLLTATRCYLLLLAIIVFASCSKPGNGTDNRVDSLPHTTNNWQCTIDGVAYTGTVDTAFSYQIFGTSPTTDTVIECTGTSTDKRANIFFKINVNRSSYGKTTATNQYHTMLYFDTVGYNLLFADKSYSATYPYLITYTLDSVTQSAAMVSFSGTMIDPQNHFHTLTNGKLTVGLTSSSGEPKSYAYTAGYSGGPALIKGTIIDAHFTANTLILEGFNFRDIFPEGVQMAIRTGSSIKPGTYKSQNGDIAYNSEYPNSTVGALWVDDQQGTMSVTINKVTGDIVEGSFNGTAANGITINNGTFRCRVKNYVPQPESSDKWGLSAGYTTSRADKLYGGNMISAVKSQQGGRYRLSMRGEADGGKTTYEIWLSSKAPLTTGTYSNFYQPSVPADLTIDSVRFYSPEPFRENRTANPLFTYYLVNSIQLSSASIYCRIDTLTATRVSGEVFGTMTRIVDGGSLNANIAVRSGYFQAGVK